MEGNNLLVNNPASKTYNLAIPVVVDGFQLHEDSNHALSYKSTKIEISMSGLKFIFNREVPLLRRIFWTCVINSVIIASIIHVNNRQLLKLKSFFTKMSSRFRAVECQMIPYPNYVIV